MRFLKSCAFLCCFTYQKTDAPEHKWFTITTLYQYEGEDPVIEYHKNWEYIGFNGDLGKFNVDAQMVVEVNNGGVLFCEQTNDYETGTCTERFEIMPHCDDAYGFTNYLVNDETTYNVEGSFDLYRLLITEGLANIYINYAPSYINHDTSVENFAQTGDSSPYVVFGIFIIAAAAGAVFILRRKSYKL